MISQKHKQGWRNPWVFALAAIVITSLSVNARLIWQASQSKGRVLDTDYSVKSHKHDAEWVEQEAKRNALGWHTHMHSDQEVGNDPDALPRLQRFVLGAAPAVLQYDLTDRAGQPLVGAEVTVQAMWPSDSSADQTLKMNETRPGHYEAKIDLDRKGYWDLRFTAKREKDDFVTEQKIFVAATH